MKLCEGCIKQDVCKYKEEVEKYIEDSKQRYRLHVKEPLGVTVTCKYKETEQLLTSPYSYDTTTTGSGEVGDDLSSPNIC